MKIYVTAAPHIIFLIILVVAHTLPIPPKSWTFTEFLSCCGSCSLEKFCRSVLEGTIFFTKQIEKVAE